MRKKLDMKNPTQLVSEPISHAILSFLTSHLQTENYQLIPLAGDASSRRYYRVVEGNHSWVLMEWEAFTADDSYPFLSVRNHFQKHGIHVPDVQAICGEKGLVLLEDLGDLTLERKFWENQNQEQILPFYRQAIDELIKIHYQATLDTNSKCTAFQVKFDTSKFLWEMNYGKEHLIEKLAQIRLTDLQNKQLQENFLSICGRLDKEAKYISHRDYHSRNLMLKLGKMRVIDFQDARMGPIQYDLVSLLHDSYVDLSSESQNQILSDYIEKSSHFNSEVLNRDKFEEIFNLQVIQRCFKACGSFSSFYNNRADTRYLKYISSTLQKVADYLEFFPQYNNFRSIISSSQLLDTDFTQL